MHYYLYLPNLHGAQDKRLRELGMSCLLRDGGAEWGKLNDGPDGYSGVVGSWPTPSQGVVRLSPGTTVEWIPSPADHSRGLTGGECWLGIDREQPPTPDDLAFSSSNWPSEPAMLADGNVWLFPVAHRLPAKHAINPKTGEHQRTIKAEYQWYFQEADRLARQMLEVLEAVHLERQTTGTENDVTIPLSDTFRFACTGLSMMYRVTPWIVGELGLLDDRSLIAAVLCATEVSAVNRVFEQKKKEADSQLWIPATSISSYVGPTEPASSA